MFCVLLGDNVAIESNNTKLGELKAGDFFGELGVLFKPGTFKDESGRPLPGHRRLRSAYATKNNVTVGILCYEDLQKVKALRPQIAMAVDMYCEATSSSMDQPGISDSDSEPISEPLSLQDSKEIEAVVQAKVEARLGDMEDRMMIRIEKLLKASSK
jgi:CRP-like cAMP-binding protein